VLAVDAIVFDCDGVLVDSGLSVERSWRRWAAHYGLDGAAVLVEAHGRPSQDTAAAWLPAGLVAEACDFIEAIELDDARHVGSIRGAFELLASLPANRWAVVTSASRQLFGARIDAAGLPHPRVVVTADDVTHGKPHPEGYASALRKLGIDGRRAAVFEDTVSGMTAAREAGVASIVRVGSGGSIGDEVAVVADLRQVIWDGRLRLVEAHPGPAGQLRQDVLLNS
jgi:mannitol-1-/sugar-/sorbitol-6-phosphatase